MTSPPHHPAPPRQENPLRSDELSPRAFTAGAGFWFRIVGAIFACSGCCLCLTSGIATSRLRQPAVAWTDFLFGPQWPAAAAVVNQLTALVGGMALLGAGIGLRAERPSSARVALGATAVMGAIQWASCAAHLFHTNWITAAFYGFLGIISILLFLLAAGCAATFRHFPPPLDQNVVSDQWLDEYHNNRRRNRGSS